MSSALLWTSQLSRVYPKQGPVVLGFRIDRTIFVVLSQYEVKKFTEAQGSSLAWCIHWSSPKLQGKLATGSYGLLYKRVTTRAKHRKYFFNVID